MMESEIKINIMNGKELINKICEILNKENKVLYDNQIVRKISELNHEQLKQLICDAK